MSLVASLPGRPLSDAELAALNRGDAVELAVAVEDAGTDEEAGPAGGAGAAPGAEGLLLATDAWVKGLALRGGAWAVVETVALADEDERYEALRTCEAAVRGDESADTGAETDADEGTDDGGNPDADTDPE